MNPKFQESHIKDVEFVISVSPYSDVNTVFYTTKCFLRGKGGC